MRQNRRRRGLLQATASFVLGAAAGSLCALLYAPASGRVIRRRISMQARNLQRSVGRRIGRTQRVLATEAQRVRAAATEWVTEHIPHVNGKHPIRRRVLRHAAAR